MRYWIKAIQTSKVILCLKESLFFKLTSKKLEILALCLITFIFPFAPVPVTAGLILLTGVIFFFKGRIREITKLPLFKQALIFWVLLILCSLFSAVPKESVAVTAIYGIFIAFYLMALIELDDRKKIFALAIVFLASASIEALLGIYQNFISQPVIDPGWVDKSIFPEITVRVFGSLDNPNILAHYLVPAILLGFGMIWQAKGLPVKTLLSTQVILMIICLIYTYSRGGWLALLLATTAFCLLRNRRLLLVASLFFLIIFWFEHDLITTRLFSITNTQETSISHRTVTWQVATQIFHDFWFSGVGPGTAAFRQIYNKFYLISGFSVFHTHNFYLELLVEIGLFGFCIFLWLLLSYFGYSLKSLTKMPETPEKTITMASLAGMTGYLAHGFVENSWYSFKLVFLFWLIMALSVSSARLYKKKDRQRLNVLQVISDTNIGGAGIYLLNFLDHCNRDLLNMYVLCPAGSLLAPKFAKKEAKVIQISRLPEDESFRIKGLFGQLLEIISTIRKYDIQVVHTHASFTGRLAAKIAGVPCIIYTKHRLDKTEPGKGLKGKLFNLINNLTCHQVIAVSQAVKENLIEQGIKAEKIEVIYNGVDITGFQAEKNNLKKVFFADSEYLVGVVARLEPEKGHRYFLEAARIILSEIDNVKFLIIGTGSLAEELKDNARKLGIDQKVVFTGLRDDIPELISIMDVLVLPSLSESFGLSLVEGMCLGKPCVASNTGGIKEIIEDGKNGLLAEPGNPKDLASKIIFLLKDPDKAQDLGIKAAATVYEKFNARTMAKKITELYLSCFKTRRRNTKEK